MVIKGVRVHMKTSEKPAMKKVEDNKPKYSNEAKDQLKYLGEIFVPDKEEKRRV